jgi:hypothetical protein
MTRMKVMKTTDQLIVTAMAALLLLPPPLASGKERIRTLGKDTLGETVKQFQTRHPKAVCGKAISMEIKAQNLVKSEDREDIHCCLNDRASLTEISPFRILNLDDCAFHATFWNRRLYGLYYMLDVRSVKTVLPDFEEFYGSPDRVFTDSVDASKLTFVDWTRGGTYLDVWLSRLGKDEESKYPKGEPWLETVSVSLYDIDFFPNRR